MRDHARVAGVLILTSLMVSCQGLQRQFPAGDNRAADERTLRDTDTEMSKAGAAKDIEKLISNYADDAILLPPNNQMAMGKPAIRVAWTQMTSAPGFGISWMPMKAEVSKSGDLGYTFGTYNMVMNDAQGRAINDRGKYVEIWKKQPDNSWKLIMDIPNSDLPTPSAAPAAQ